jgi:hypothetical protein
MVKLVKTEELGGKNLPPLQLCQKLTSDKLQRDGTESFTLTGQQ